jgi:3-hydroxyisobutyrate dehydrogenase-like beta-hydroxyacid dehydrogenase
MVTSVGLLGLGNMGSALAHRLTPHFTVYAYDPDPDRAAWGKEEGLHICDSVEAVAHEVTVVVLSLPRPAISHDAVTRIATVWDAGGAVIETSTITPDDAKAASRVGAAQGITYVDAAILSGVKSVEQGTTSLLVGGDSDALRSVQPVLDAITTNQRHLGGIGAGMAAKVINNAVAHAVYVVLSEAVAMATANEIPIPTLVELLGDPEAGLLRPLTHRVAQRLNDRDFEGGMPVDAARKDSELALRLAQSAGIPLFAIQSAHTVYEIALARGMARADYSVIATLWDR